MRDSADTEFMTCSRIQTEFISFFAVKEMDCKMSQGIFVFPQFQYFVIANSYKSPNQIVPHLGCIQPILHQQLVSVINYKFLQI